MKRWSPWVARAAVCFPAVALVAMAVAPAFERGGGTTWRGDLASARVEAKSAGKDLLVEFTVRRPGEAAPSLDRKVFDDAEFLQFVGRKFVPVRLTVNTDGGQGGNVDVVTLAERLAVGRVPSLVLMDAEGRPYGAVASEAESVEVQVALVRKAADERAKRDEAFARAAQSSGGDRAVHLDTALQHVAGFALTGYESSAREIVALDPQNALGLKDKYAGPLAEKRIDARVQSGVYPLIDRANFAGAIEAIDQIISEEKPPAAPHQMLLGFKGQVLYSMGRKDDARRLLRDALALAPDGASAATIRASIEQLAE